MTTLAVTAAVVLVSLAGTMLVFGEACNHVPFMTSADACLHISPNTTERRHELCRDMLMDAPARAEATVYAIVAARQTRLRYRDGVGEVDKMLSPDPGGGNLPADDIAAFLQCRDKYEEAAGAADGRRRGPAVFACDLSKVRQEYIHAQVNIRSCLDGLSAYRWRGSPVFDWILEDIDMTMVAYLLGAIVVGR